MEREMLFSFSQQVSAPDDEALKESAYAPLFFPTSFSFTRT